MNDKVRCPACDSLEWFPGAACFKCGWEGLWPEAYAKLIDRVDDLETKLNRYTPQVTRMGELLGENDQLKRLLGSVLRSPPGKPRNEATSAARDELLQQGETWWVDG